MELKVGTIYVLSRKIGVGSFGDIYLGRNKTTNEEVAIKLERVKTRHPQLESEYEVYQHLKSLPGVPAVYWFGQEGDYKVLVMQLLGPSLDDLFQLCNERFSMKTVLQLADQLIGRLEDIHSKHYIHRDIKPENFLLGPNKDCVYIIDFGLAKAYFDVETQSHIPYREDLDLVGTARYASLNSHLGIEQCRREDLESLGFMLIRFLRGSLPWEGIPASTKREKQDKITSKKMTTSTETLTEGLPNAFKQYLDYCRSLPFENQPDYSYLRSLFRDTLIKNGYTNDGIYDWTTIDVPKKRKLEAKN